MNLRTPEEVDRAIERLRKRIADVKALDPTKVRYNDQAVRNVERAIRSTVDEIFGSESLIHSFSIMELGSPELAHVYVRPYPVEQTNQQRFAAGLPQMVTMLAGLIVRLEERNADLVHDPAARARSIFEGVDLHPRIREACADLYRDGHYPQAVFEASKALVNLVKEKARRHDKDGADLMRTVFSVNAPVLAFNDRADQSEKDEQEGLMHLYEGAVQALKNPRSHAVRTDTPEDALEYLVLLSMLAKRADRAKRP